MTRYAIYARYSSENQRTASIEDQVRRCREYIERAGGHVDSALVFADAAVSGTTTKREGFERMLGMALGSPRGLDVIVTEDLSRLSRDIADAATLFKRLKYEGVRVVSVADGLDTDQLGAKMQYTMKALMAESYIDDLRDKTRRGMVGRALRGYSTGNPPTGYRSVPEHGPRGEVIGHRIEIDPEGAASVRLIFELYADGLSYSAIARELNARGIRSRRPRATNPTAAWDASAVREMLRNPKYIGRWAFNARAYMRSPVTGKRVARKKAASEVVVHEAEELRIIDQSQWDLVQTRLERNAERFPGVRGTSGRGLLMKYPLSGLLACGVCGGPMCIHGGGTGQRYYRCQASVKKGTCANRLSVRESVAKECVLGAIRGILSDERVVELARRRVAQRLADFSASFRAQAGEHGSRLRATEAKIANLVRQLEAGLASASIVQRLGDLERDAAQQRQLLAETEAASAAPPGLPTPHHVAESLLDLEARIQIDVARGREGLRRFLKGEPIRCMPDGSSYVAYAQVLPFPLLLSQLNSREITPPQLNEVRHLAQSARCLSFGLLTPR